MASLARAGSVDATPLALAICASCGVRGINDCIMAFDMFLRDNFNYRGEHEEVLRTVPFMINDLQTIGEMQGDCDDMCIMACSLFCASGITSRMTAIKSHPGEFDHVFSEAMNEAGEWVPVDPTVEYGTPYVHYGISYQAV